MRTLILNIIIVFICQTSLLAQQTYEFKNWAYPIGYPCCSTPNDSLLDNYDKNKDIILDFKEGEHSVCRIKIKDKHLKFYRFKYYWIYEVEVLDVYWTYKSLNSGKLKTYKFISTRKYYKKNTIFIGTFWVAKEYLSLLRELNLNKNIRYYVSQPLVIMQADDTDTLIDKIIQRKYKK